jgi:hypothetical protein
MLSAVHGYSMINKQTAIEIKGHALNAVSELSKLLNAAEGRCSSEEYEQIKRGVGLSIGRIQTELLDTIYATYPELDELK